MTKREELLLEFAKKFEGVFNKKMKSRIYISGSIALKMQGFKTRRECGDVDFVIQENKDERVSDIEDFVYTNFPKFDLENESDESDDEYGEDGNILMFEGFFKDESIRFQILYPEEKIRKRYIAKYHKWVTPVNDIMHAKIDYSLCDMGDFQKHRDDIIYFLQNNF